MLKKNLNLCLEKLFILLTLLSSIYCDLIIRTPKEIQTQFISKHLKKN